MPSVNLINVRVKPSFYQAFIEAALANREGTRAEPGNIAFDVLRDPQDPSAFLLYEVFADEAAIAEHKQTPHYLAWRDTVAEMMEVPRQPRPLVPIGVG